MASLSKESSTVRETAANPGFTKRVNIVGTSSAPAPAAVLHLVKCGCKKDRCDNNRCKCRKAGVQCTDLCSCADNEEDDCCHNVPDKEENGEQEENGDIEDDREEYDDEVDEEVI